MPKYNYKCSRCSSILEVSLSYDDTRNKNNSVFFCNECNSESVHKRQITNTSFSLRGPCWEKDGYTDACSKHRKESRGKNDDV